MVGLAPRRPPFGRRALGAKWREGGLVLTGRFELTVSATKLEREAGDSCQVDATIPHTFRNLADEETRVMWIIRSDAAA